MIRALSPTLALALAHFVTTSILALAAPEASALPTVVSIGNDPSSQSGDSINAIDLANTLCFTSVTIASEGDVRVVDSSDLSVSPVFGPTLFDLFLQAPDHVDVLGDLTMGAGGVWLNAPTVRLRGTLRDASGVPLDQTRLHVPNAPMQIEVGSGGSAEQASWLAYLNPSHPVEIVVDGANDPASINVWSNTRLELRAGQLENVTLLAAGSVFDWKGGQLGETGLFGFGGTTNVYGHDFERGPAAVCSGLPPSSWQPAPATITNAQGCLRGVLSSGESFVAGFNFGGTIHLIPTASPAPVPTAGWLLGPVLALAGALAARPAIRPAIRP